MQGTPAKAEHDRMHHIMVKVGRWEISPYPSGLHQTIRKPLKSRDFWDVSMSFSWVYYKTKGYKKASCHDVSS